MALLHTGNFADLNDRAIDEIFSKVQATEEEPSKEFYYYDKVDVLNPQDSSISGLTGWSRDTETSESLAVDMYQGWNKQYNVVGNSGFLRLTRRMQLSLKARNLWDKIEDLKKAGIRFKEGVLHGPLNNPTSTSYTDTTGQRNFTVTNTGGDGVAPQSTAHTREDAGTDISNKVVMSATNNPDFAYDALKAAHTVGAAIRGPVGEVSFALSLDSLICVYGSDAYFQAMEMLANLKSGQPRTKPGVADNSSAAQIPFRIIATKYLTTSTYWAMFDSSRVGKNYGFQFKELVPPTPAPESIRMENGEIRRRVEHWFDFGFNDLARCMVISLGTNA